MSELTEENITIPDVPDGFLNMCQQLGLAILLGQKTQFALAHYFAYFGIVNWGWGKSTVDKSIQKHLSRPMGAVIKDIEKRANLPEDLMVKIKTFRDERNWLVHDFDEESTPFIRESEKVEEFGQRIFEIMGHSIEIDIELGQIGKELERENQARLADDEAR